MVVKGVADVWRGRARRGSAGNAKRSASPCCSRRAASSRSCCSPPPQRGGILGAVAAQFLVLAVTMSMLLAPLVVRAARAPARALAGAQPGQPEFDTIDGPGNPVIIAGYGRYGQIVSRVLRMAGIPFTAHRGELPAGRFRAPLRQQGVLRRRVAARAAASRPRPATPSSSCSRSTTSRRR